MSSMFSAVFAKSSLTSIPFLPYFLKENGDGNGAPVRRSVRRFSRASGLPAYFARAGFGSNVSTCEGPAVMDKWITGLGLAGKLGYLGVSGLVTSPGFAFAASKPAWPI